MAKKYLNGLLLHETLPEFIDIHTWLKHIILEQPQYPKIWDFLEKAGRYFHNPLVKYPENINVPNIVQRGHCHMNNFLYAEILADKHEDILSDFRFVVGLWLLSKKSDLASLFKNKDENYFIGCHSFMTYKGNVLDCTTLTHQPFGFEVTQRYGISFHITDAVKVFNHLKNTKTLSITPVIEAFHSMPYSKE